MTQGSLHIRITSLTHMRRSFSARRTVSSASCFQASSKDTQSFRLMSFFSPSCFCKLRSSSVAQAWRADNYLLQPKYCSHTQTLTYSAHFPSNFFLWELDGPGSEQWPQGSFCWMGALTVAEYLPLKGTNVCHGEKER